MSDKLPDGWTRHFSQSNKREYFYHNESGKSVWKIDDLPKLDLLIEQENAVQSSKSETLADISKPDLNNDSDMRLHSSKVKVDQAAVKRKGYTDASEESKRAKHEENSIHLTPESKELNSDKSGINLVVIVPFRDQDPRQHRGSQLRRFVDHMEDFLGSNKSISSHHLLIVEQSDDGRKFNRGKLLNSGFKYATQNMKDRNFHSFVFHDVDLLPRAPLEKWYGTYPTQPIHIARVWDRYNRSDSYLGGIVSFDRESFQRIDGFPTTFWGWGGEDDELHKRIVAEKIRIDGPDRNIKNAIYDLENMNLAQKRDFLKESDCKCNVKWEVRDEYKRERRRKAEIPWWGLSGTKYEVLHEEKLGPNANKITLDILYNYNSDGSEHWANNVTDLPTSRKRKVN